jgi:hypothetical protein
MRAALAAAAVALATPLFAHAQPVSEPAGPDTYLQVHLGAYLPRASNDNLDTGYTVGGVFGARFTRHLAAEAGISYDRATGPGSETLADVPITASLVGRLPFKRAELAAYAGPDLHLVRLTLGGTTQSSSVFGLHYGVRAGFNVWPTTLVGIDAGGDLAEARFGTGFHSISGFRIALTLQYRL